MLSLCQKADHRGLDMAYTRFFTVPDLTLRNVLEIRVQGDFGQNMSSSKSTRLHVVPFLEINLFVHTVDLRTGHIIACTGQAGVIDFCGWVVQVN